MLKAVAYGVCLVEAFLFITVKCLNGFSKLLTYEAPDDWSSVVTGRIVQVPLKNRMERALIVAVSDRRTPGSFAIRSIASLEPAVVDVCYQDFVARLSSYYAVDSVYIYRRLYEPGRIALALVPVVDHDVKRAGHALTDEQELVVRALRVALHERRFHPMVVHGVTGSGKTVVYAAAIRELYALKKTVVLLLPEVTLAVTVAQILRGLVGNDIAIYECHSSTTASEKRELWAALLHGIPCVIVGVHIPIILPIMNLGLIIVDEEHEPGYQEKRHPHINSRDAALLRAQVYKIPIILGSATPSIASLHAVATKGWSYYLLKKRFSGNFPVIKHVFVRPLQKPVVRGQSDFFWISIELREAIASALARGEQAIVFLNRRGMHRFVQCVSCAGVLMCAACSVSLTVHGNGTLICHYCGAVSSMPHICPYCAAPAEKCVKKGVGTQRIVAILETLFPHARIARADADTTKECTQWQKTVAAVIAGEIDIIVGTQTITKGYHFPRVTVVGIIWADSNLMVPFYSSAERSLQQILQVAGRAGRAAPHSRVIVQSCIKHPIFNFLDETRYREFYQYELAQRADSAYPPHVRLSEIELSNKNEHLLIRDADIAAACIRWYIAQHGVAVTVLGPALPPVYKVQHMFFRKIYLKGTSVAVHLQIYHALHKRLKELDSSSACWFTPNPTG